MKLTSLTLRNWLIHSSLSLQFSPMTVIAGGNGHGKTSIADAIAFAMLADLRRVKAKGERDQLITEGSDSGSVSVTFGEATITRSIADGKITARAPLPIDGAVQQAIPLLLDAGMLSRVTDDERRAALLQIMRVDLGATGIIAELKGRGHSDKIVEQLLPDAGIDEWLKLAERTATERRGMWKAITKETYGSAKALDWQAPGPANARTEGELAEAKAAIVTARETSDALHRRLGEMDAIERAAKAAQTRRAELEKTVRDTASAAALEEEEAGLLAEHTADLEAARIRLAVMLDGADPGSVPCPHCGAGIVIEGSALRAWTPPAKAISIRDTELQENRVQTLERRTPELQQRLSVASAMVKKRTGAIAELAALNGAGMPEGVKQGEMADLERQKVAASDEAERATLLVREIENDITAERQAGQRTAEARAAHDSLVAWQALRDDLLPDGIPGDLLKKAMGPFNETLTRLSMAAEWAAPVFIRPDMTITYGGRAYGLLSESEKWRVDTTLAVAAAQHSGLRFVILDRFDVLEPAARRPTMAWLYRMVTAAGLAMDSIVLIGTFKAPPQLPKDVTVHWLGEPETARAQAA